MRNPPKRKRGIFVGVWLNEEEHRTVKRLAVLAGEPDSLSAGLRQALRLAVRVRLPDESDNEAQP